MGRVKVRNWNKGIEAFKGKRNEYFSVALVDDLGHLFSVENLLFI